MAKKKWNGFDPDKRINPNDFVVRNGEVLNKEWYMANKEINMFDLNELCVMAYENASKREAKDGKVSTETRKMLKHCATEVVESAEAYNSMVDGVANKEIFASELADIVCCVLIIAGKENIDMEYALTACMEKNYKRAIGEGDK